LRNAAGLIQSDPFLLLNGDSYCRVDVQRFKSEHEKFKARATLWVLPVEDCGRYGSIQIGGGGVVTAFKEKSESHLPGLINSGVYMLSREFVTSIQPGLERSIEREVFPEFIGNGLYATTGEGPFLDIGTPEAYGAAWQALKEDLLMLTPNEKPTEIQKFRPPSKGGLNP
jgi:NDP-sugar pyrophosphorylase family protein